ncbi:MAG: SDR family oxidoreductase [Dysgonamonadaceae bacterium]|jgi:short-subunit dehydrogenase|nr:SDR family oxidoreductase [Dysgonamonadaceae bacterium]
MRNKFYQDKVAIVTGASSGIGAAIAIELVSRGAKVVLGARREEKLREVADTIKNNDGEVSYCVVDVTDELQCKKLIETTIERYGKLDILVCNAGISMRANFENVKMEVLHRLMNVNFWGAVYCTKYALPHLIKSKGNLIGISSVAGVHGLPGRTGYSASKYALTGFLDTIRIENLKKGLHVMIAIPGFTSSNIRYTALIDDGSEQGYTPRNEGKMMSAERAAKLITNGIQRKKRYLYMDFEGKAVALIKRFSTALLDRIFYKTMAKEENSPLK